MAMASKDQREPADEATIDEALRLMKPTPHVTPEVKAALATELPGIADSVTEIARMSPLRLASKLIGTEGVAEDDLMDVARELIAAFRAMLGLDSAPPQPQGPLNMTVQVEKRLGELTARELLGHLVADPGQFDDVAEALRATRLVRHAGQSPWAIPGLGGGLDVTATAEYLEYLSRPGSIPQRLWPPRGGTRPETLESAFGREARLMVNPFTGQTFAGFDEWGNDWNELPETDHLAMRWAVATGHRNLPPVPDARRLTDDLFAKKRPAYLREITEDFTEARRHDPQLAAMSRYFTGETATGLAAAQARPRRSEEDYLKLLLGAAQGDRTSMSGDIRLGATVVESFKTMSGDVVLNGTVVLRGGSTMSGDLKGTCYVPRGVTISTISGDDRLDVYVRSYADLARQAGLT
jgi:hypothetical protein